MADVFGPTAWIDPAYNLNPYGMVPGALPPVAGGGPAPKSSGFGWGDLALPFLAGTAGLALGMQKPNITGPLYQLGALGSLLQMREQYGEQREEALRLRNQDMFAKRVMEVATRTGDPNAINELTRQAIQAGLVTPTEAEFHAQAARNVAQVERGNQQASDQQMGITPMLAGGRATAQPFQSTVPSYNLSDTSFPVQLREAPAQPTGGPQAGPSAVTPLPSLGATEQQATPPMQRAFIDPKFPKATRKRLVGGGEVIEDINVAANYVNNYLQLIEQDANAAHVPPDYGSALNNIRQTTVIPEVVTITENLQRRLWEGTFREELQRTGNPLKAAEAATKTMKWIPPGDHPAHKYVLPLNPVELGEMAIAEEMQKVIGQLQSALDNGLNPKNLTGVFDPQGILERVRKGGFPVTQQHLKKILEGAAPYLEKMFVSLRDGRSGPSGLVRGPLPELEAVQVAQAILPGVSISSSMEGWLKPPDTAEALAARQGGLWGDPKQVKRSQEQAAGEGRLNVDVRASDDAQGQAQLRANQMELAHGLIQTAKTHPDWFGGAAGWRGQMRSFEAWMDKAPPGFTDFSNDTERLRAELLRALAGANIGPAEREIYFNVFPSIKHNSSQQFISNAQKTLQNIRRLDQIAVAIQRRERIIPPAGAGAQEAPPSPQDDNLNRLRRGAGMLPR